MAAYDALRQRMPGAEVGAAIVAVLGIAGGECVPIVRHLADHPARSAGKDTRETHSQPLAKIGGEFGLESLSILFGF